MKEFLSSDEIKEQVKGFENMLLGVKKLLESARREGLPAWQLDTSQIENFVAEFEQELVRLSDLQREFEKKQPEFDALQASGMEFLERVETFEIHSRADYEKSQRFIEESAAQQEFIEAQFAPFIEAWEQTCNRILSLQERLLALCRLDTEGSA